MKPITRVAADELIRPAQLIVDHNEIFVLDGGDGTIKVFSLETGKFIAFNALQNGLAVLDPEVVKEITHLEKGCNPNLEETTLKELIKGNCAVAGLRKKLLVLCG